MTSRQEVVRLRLGDGLTVEVPSHRQAEPSGRPAPLTVAAPLPCAAAPQPVAPNPLPLSPLVAPAVAPGAVLALVEAVPAGAEELAVTVADTLTAAGSRVALVGLDKQNRLGVRLGVTSASQPWHWKAEPGGLPVRSGPYLVVPGPAQEAELNSEDVERAIRHVQREAAVVVVDLGCRWDPRIFRPVLQAATHIWILTRPGQWSGAEMRLEQAEFSGWTDMRMVRVVVMGPGAPPPGSLGAPVAGNLPDVRGREAAEFVVREVGRVCR